MTRRSDLLPIIASLRWTWEQVVACLWLRHLSRQLINSSQFYVPIFALFLFALFDADKLSLSEPRCPKIHLIAIWISFRAKRWELTSFFGCVKLQTNLSLDFQFFLMHVLLTVQKSEYSQRIWYWRLGLRGADESDLLRRKKRSDATFPAASEAQRTQETQKVPCEHLELLDFSYEVVNNKNASLYSIVAQCG